MLFRSGFATTDQVQEFTFEYGGADKETLSYAFTFEDEPTTVEFTKTSLTDGKEIEGAKLKVTDESGNTVDCLLYTSLLPVDQQ